MTRGRFTILVVAVAVIAIIAITGVSIDLSGGDDDKRAESKAAAGTTATPSATAEEPDKSDERRKEASKPGSDPDVVRGSEEIALNRPANLRRAVAVLDKHRVKAEGVFEDLRIAPGRIDTQVRNRREIIDLQVRTDFSVPFNHRIDFPGDADVIARGLRGRDVDAHVPARLLRKIDERRDTTTSASDLDYMVVGKGLIDHEIAWSVFFKRGPRPRAWRADGPNLALTPIG